MSVATKNPFALLEAEDTSRPSTPAPAAAPESAQPSTTAPTRGNQRSRGGPASRGGKYYQRGGGVKPAPARENETEEPAAGGEKPKRTFDGEGRGRGRGRGRGDHRGGDRHGGGGGDRPPREGGRGGPRNREPREPRPDRHSATGKTDSDKKVHQSWGGDDGPTELKVEEAAQGDAAAESGNNWGNDAGTAADDPWKIPPTSGDEPPMPASAEGGAGDKAEGGRRGRDRDAEEEDNTLTLEQYLAQKAEKEASLLPKLEVRKANEGTDDSLWKDAIKVMKGEEEESYFAGKTKSAPKTRVEKKEKIYIEIDGPFGRPERGRGGRGGGRGDRGDRGPRTPRGGRNGGRTNGYAPPVVNVNDESVFPSLS